MIGCTRCGATQEGDIILPAIAFTFKHNKGCGHGVGPLAVLPRSKPKVSVSKSFAGDKKEIIFKELEKEDVIVEEKPKKSKFRSFGKKGYN